MSWGILATMEARIEPVIFLAFLFPSIAKTFVLHITFCLCWVQKGSPTLFKCWISKCFFSHDMSSSLSGITKNQDPGTSFFVALIRTKACLHTVYVATPKSNSGSCKLLVNRYKIQLHHLMSKELASMFREYHNAQAWSIFWGLSTRLSFGLIIRDML